MAERRFARLGLIGVLSAAALLLLASAAHGAVTIGSDLAPDPDAAGSCSPPTAACTIANPTMTGQQVTSPIDGAVVRWRLRVDQAEITGNGVRLRVLHPDGTGNFTGVNSSITQTIPDPVPVTTFMFPTQQAIKAGEQVALDVDADNANFLIIAMAQPGVTFARWQPPLADTGTRPPDSMLGPPAPELLLNADVEPDRDCDGAGDETQDAAVTGGCLPVSGPAPSPPKAQAARLLTTKANSDGKVVPLEMECPAGGVDCSSVNVSLKTAGAVRLQSAALRKKAKGVVLGKAVLTIPAGTRKMVRVKLTAKGRKVVRQKRSVKTRVAVNTTAAGQTLSATGTVKVKGPKRKRT